MKKTFYAFCIVFSCFSALAQAQDIYLYFPPYTDNAGVDGREHRDEVRLTSIQSGIARAISSPAGGKREASAPSFSEYTVTKSFDLSSTKFMTAVSGGRKPEMCEIRYYSGDEVVLKIELGQVLLSSYSSSSGGGIGGGCPDCPAISESISLNFTTIRVINLVENPPVEFSWNLERNTKL